MKIPHFTTKLGDIPYTTCAYLGIDLILICLDSRSNVEHVHMGNWYPPVGTEFRLNIEELNRYHR